MRGYCHGHYLRLWKYGDVRADVPFRMGRASPEERFQAKVEKTDTCWLWTGTVHKTTGYGITSVEGRHVLAHRWSYEHFVGSIPKGLHLDHLCRVRHCVRPDHLEPVTQGENNRRAAAAKPSTRNLTTHCGNGHLYDEANTSYYPNGQRRCRACGRDIARRSYWKKKKNAA